MFGLRSRMKKEKLLKNYKRLMREAFRHIRHDLPVGLDLILIPRQNSGGTVENYKRSLKGICRRLLKRLPVKTEAGD